MYKLLQIKKVLMVINEVYRVDTDTLLEFNTFTEDDEAELIVWLYDHGFEDDQYLICLYEDGVYQATVGVVFFHRDNVEESFVDGAEWDFRVLGDVAHKSIPVEYLEEALLNGIKRYNLYDKVADLIDEEYTRRDL